MFVCEIVCRNNNGSNMVHMALLPIPHPIAKDWKVILYVFNELQNFVRPKSSAFISYNHWLQTYLKN